MPCCSIPIIPRNLSFDCDLVPPKLEMLWINWTLFYPSTQATRSYLSSVIFLILSLVRRLLFKASWKELRFLFPSSFEGSSVKCFFHLLDDIFWNWRSMNWRLKWRSLIPVLLFHTELIASVAFIVSVFIFFIFLFVGSFDDPEQGGELFLFQNFDAIRSRNFIMSSWFSCWIYGKGF